MKGRKSLNRKWLAITVIVLFIGTITPIISGTLVLDDDTTPPVTTNSFDPPTPNGENGWYVSNVTVTLNATDDESGVNVTYYTLNATGGWHRYTEPFLMSMDGNHSIEYYSVDNAGNVEDIKSVICKIDQTRPCIIAGPINRFLKTTLYAVVADLTSGINRVEFYLDTNRSTLVGTDYDAPYECEISTIPLGLPCWLTGFILFPHISSGNVSFYALFVWAAIGLPRPIVYDNAGNHAKFVCYGEGAKFFLGNQHLTLSSNYTGHIGWFFIDAGFEL